MEENNNSNYEDRNIENKSGFLRLVNLSKGYFDGKKQRVVLERTCFQFQRGEFTAILGKSGSGKTTLLNLISGIDRADSGSIFLNDIDLTNLSENERTMIRRKKVGFIFQFFNLIPTLSIWENVTLPLELNNQMDTRGRKKAEELLEAVSLLDRKSHFPDQLSGGEQQRISIARALVHDPLLLLADEPTGNLDEETGIGVLKLLDQLTRKNGKNLILVTHSPTAAAFADRILILKDGHLSEDHRGKGVSL
jgi:putative ABC transport system ATP-binding protein